jgi:hypothetical protein
VRFVAEWALVAAPFLATTVPTLGQLRRPAMALLAAALVTDGITTRLRQPIELGLAEDVVPFAAINFVTRNDLRERLYEDLDVGCYLLWEGWPRYRVFQDARLPAYPDEFHRALDDTALSPAAWDALLRRYGVDAALVAYPGINVRAGSFDPDEWALVYRAPDALVFARRSDAHRDVISRHEIPLRVDFDMQNGSRVTPIAAPPARSPVPLAEWRRRLVDELAQIAAAAASD